MADKPKCYKLLLVGDSSVGKSSLVKRYTNNSFEAGIGSTVGVDYSVKSLPLGDEEINLKIWDTAGSERFKALTKGYYRDSLGVLLVYDITKQKTFDGLKFWIKEVKDNNSVPWAIRMIIGNKLDLETRREVQKVDAVEYANSVGCLYGETSAKSDLGVEKVFELVAEKIREKKNQNRSVVQQPSQTQNPAAGGAAAVGVSGEQSKTRSRNCCLMC